MVNTYLTLVAGLVGIGLNALFIQSGLESHPKLVLATEKRVGSQITTLTPEYLPNRMGLFLQKINILKDFYGDLREGRVFWPREIWEKHIPQGFEKDLSFFTLPENKQAALDLLNELCADALALVPDCLEYLSLLSNPSIFAFCAIPQVMAISSLALFYNNPAIFAEKPVKIRRGTAVELMLKCTDIEAVKQTYLFYINQLHRKGGDIKVCFVVVNSRWLLLAVEFKDGAVFILVCLILTTQ